MSESSFLTLGPLVVQMHEPPMVLPRLSTHIGATAFWENHPKDTFGTSIAAMLARLMRNTAARTLTTTADLYDCCGPGASVTTVSAQVQNINRKLGKITGGRMKIWRINRGYYALAIDGWVPC